MKSKWMKGLVLASICMTGTIQAGVIENLISSFWKSEDKSNPIMGVLIAHDVPGVVLEVKGKYKIFDPHAQKFISTRFIGKRKFVQAISDGIKWGEEFPTVHQIQIVPDDAKTTTVVDGIEYKGVITVYDIGGTISVVNDIPLDDYVKTILAPYSSPNLPEELRAAFAIIERTNAWNQLQNSPSRYFSVDKEKVNYQGYAATLKENSFVPAINETRNMILTKNGVPYEVNLFAENKRDFNNFKPSLGQISYDDAIALANQGKHAAQILNQAYPGTSITLMTK